MRQKKSPLTEKEPLSPINVQRSIDKHNDGSDDMYRARKDSFFEYKKVIESNGEDLD